MMMKWSYDTWGSHLINEFISRLSVISYFLFYLVRLISLSLGPVKLNDVFIDEVQCWEIPQ
jgi:hypothetical protein